MVQTLPMDMMKQEFVEFVDDPAHMDMDDSEGEDLAKVVKPWSRKRIVKQNKVSLFIYYVYVCSIFGVEGVDLF